MSMLQRVSRMSRLLSCSSKVPRMMKLSLRTTESTTQWKTKLASLHETMSSNETESLYDEWASQYDNCLEEWGYKVPAITSELLKKYYQDWDKKQIKVFDLGCGTGLVGQEILKDVDATIYGSDLSSGQFQLAKDKGYTDLKTWDLNKLPYPYEDNAFDVLTCAGTLTYAEDKVSLFNEWLRITKPGAIIICSHRSDMMKEDLKYFDEMQNNGKWKRLEVTDAVPYLPNNENYGMNVLVQFYIATNEKKE